jgi:hypothetical protein
LAKGVPMVPLPLFFIWGMYQVCFFNIPLVGTSTFCNLRGYICGGGFNLSVPTASVCGALEPFKKGMQPIVRLTERVFHSRQTTC